MSSPEPTRLGASGPPPAAGAGGPPLRLASDSPEARAQASPPGADAIIADWLAALDPMLPATTRHGCLEELSDHLRCRVHDLMLTGQPEAKAARTACEEMGEAAQIADRFRSALSAPRRRLAMNLSILGCSAVGLVAGVMALSRPHEPVPVSVFQSTPVAAAPEGFLEAKVTVGKGALLGALLNELGAPSKLTVDPAWNAFEEVGLNRETSLDLEYDKTTVDAVLKDVNAHLEPQQRFEWRAQGQRLVFAPQAYFDRREQVLATYDIAGILRARAEAEGNPNAGDAAAEEVAHLIAELVEPEHWRENGGDLAGITRFGDKLFVKAPPRMHRQVEWVLSELPTAPVRELWVEGQAPPPKSVRGEQPDDRQRAAKRAKTGDANPPGESVRIVPLKYTAADDVAKALTGVLVSASLDGVVMSGVRVQAISQTNSLVIVAGKDQHEVLMPLIDELERGGAERMERRQMEMDKQNQMEQDRRRAEQARLKDEAANAGSPK